MKSVIGKVLYDIGCIAAALCLVMGLAHVWRGDEGDTASHVTFGVINLAIGVVLVVVVAVFKKHGVGLARDRELAEKESWRAEMRRWRAEMQRWASVGGGSAQ